MRIETSDRLRQWIGKPDLEFVEVDDKTLQYFQQEADRAVSYLEPAVRDDWAVFSALTHPGHNEEATGVFRASPPQPGVFLPERSPREISISADIQAAIEFNRKEMQAEVAHQAQQLSYTLSDVGADLADRLRVDAAEMRLLIQRESAIWMEFGTAVKQECGQVLEVMRRTVDTKERRLRNLIILVAFLWALLFTGGFLWLRHP